MRLMTYTPDITARTPDPLDLAATCLEAATIHADRAHEKRENGDHSAAGVDREQQRYYLARGRMYAEIAKVEALRSIAADLNRLRLEL